MNARKTGIWLLCVALFAACPSKPSPAQEAEGRYLEGTTEYLHGNFDKALAAFAEVRRLSPEDPRLPVAVGEVYLVQGKLPEALKEFQAAVARDPKKATAWSRIAYLQAQLGDAAAARTAAERALALNPKDFNALETRAELSAKAGDVDAAVRDYAAAGRLAPDPSRAPLYLEAATLLERRDRRLEALAVLDDAVHAGAKSGELFTKLGELRVREGDLGGAAQAYREAAALLPKDPIPWELVGRIEAQLGHAEAAAEAFGKSLAVKDRAAVHVARARLALDRKDADAARQELDQALAAYGEDTSAAETEELAELLETLKRKQDALRLYALLAEEPGAQKDSALQRKVARLARELGDRAALKVACERVIAQEGKTAKCP